MVCLDVFTLKTNLMHNSAEIFWPTITSSQTKVWRQNQFFLTVTRHLVFLTLKWCLRGGKVNFHIHTLHHDTKITYGWAFVKYDLNKVDFSKLIWLKMSFKWSDVWMFLFFIFWSIEYFYLDSTSKFDVNFIVNFSTNWKYYFLSLLAN